MGYIVERQRSSASDRRIETTTHGEGVSRAHRVYERCLGRALKVISTIASGQRGQCTSTPPLLLGFQYAYRRMSIYSMWIDVLADIPPSRRARLS